MVSLLKKVALLVSFLAITIPLRYGSTNLNYLSFRILHSLLSFKHSLVPDRARPELSADYRAFESLLRLNPLVELNETADSLEVAKELRSSFSLNTIVPRPARCQVNKRVYEHDGHTVDAYWINDHQGKKQINTDQFVLYFHGGAYMMGDIHSYSGFECHLSRLFNVSVLHLEYRLVPEHPLPSAVDDALTLYHALLRENVSPSRMTIMGDSAGGGLALLTVQSLIARQLPVPCAIVLMSPWADLSSSGESYTRNRLIDPMLRFEKLAWSIAQVLGPDHTRLARDNPIYSPLFGSFQRFPSMYVTVGTAELLEDDSRQVVDKAQEAGVDVIFQPGQHLMHVHPLFFAYYPEARNTLDAIRQWIQAKFRQELKQ